MDEREWEEGGGRGGREGGRGGEGRGGGEEGRGRGRGEVGKKMTCFAIYFSSQLIRNINLF